MFTYDIVQIQLSLKQNVWSVWIGFSPSCFAVGTDKNISVALRLCDSIQLSVQREIFIFSVNQKIKLQRPFSLIYVFFFTQDPMPPLVKSTAVEIN